LIETRNATKEDNSALIELQRRCPSGTYLVLGVDSSPDYFARSKPFSDGHVLVAIEDGAVVGSAAYAISDSLIAGKIIKVAYEYGFMVDPYHRRKGVAQKLQKLIEQTILERNVDFLYLTIIEDNLPSIGLFTKMGFSKAKDCEMLSLMAYKKEEVNGINIRSMREADVESIVGLINTIYRGYSLFKPFEPSGFLDHVRRMPYFNLENILVAEDNGQIKACLGYWDYNKVRRYIVEKMSWKLRAQKSAIKVASLLSTMPQIPRLGQPLQSYNLTTMAWKDPQSLTKLLRYTLNIAVEHGIGFLHTPLDPTSQTRAILTQFRHTKMKLHVFIKSIGTEEPPDLSEEKLYIDAIEI